MQGFPQAAPHMSAGSTAPVAGINYIPAVAPPQGVTPNVTQGPAAGFSGGPAFGGPRSYSGAPAYGGLAGSAPIAGYTPPGYGAAPSIMPTPGPATLGPASAAGGTGAGGVQGVSMAPISGVMPPAVAGGPHPLPGMPSAPLPQGFPNPFQTQHVAQQPPQPGGGIQTVTGPMGYMPGIGYFGTPPQAGRPGMPGPAAAVPGFAQPSPQPGPPQASALSPFWLQLGWQLLQAGVVRERLGESNQRLLEPPALQQTIQVAANALLGPELQAAFREMSQGTLTQSLFLERFANGLQQALRSAELLT